MTFLEFKSIPTTTCDDFEILVEVEGDLKIHLVKLHDIRFDFEENKLILELGDEWIKPNE